MRNSILCGVVALQIVFIATLVSRYSNADQPSTKHADDTVIKLDDVPTKTDTQPIDVIVPNTVEGIHWLNTKIAVERTFRFQGYFADRFPWVSNGVEVKGNTFNSDIWVPKDGALSKLSGLTQKQFAISHKGHYPVTYQVPADLKGGEKMLLRAHLYGWGGASNYCENFGDNHGYISVRNCASEYPDSSMKNGMSVWAFYGGYPNSENVSNENGERVAESLLSVAARHANSIDHGAGFTLAGNSYGGSGSILLSMTIPHIQKQIAVVDAMVPVLMFIKHFYKKTTDVQRAWKGIDPDIADFRVVAPTGIIDHVFYRVHGGSKDKTNNDPEFFEICNAHKIACLGTWHGGGHAPNEAGLNMPAGLYPGDSNMQARLDSVLPVFTNSTGNSPAKAARGHYNLGLSWNVKSIVNKNNALIVPLRYKAFRNFSSDPEKAIPDMPEKITASVTLRRSPVFKILPGATLNWQFGSQSGVVTAHPDKPEVTIDGLRFSNQANSYTNLELKHL